MSLVLEPISFDHVEEIFEFEKKRLPEVGPDTLSSIDRDIVIWNSKWRKESIEFYIQSGWAFMVRDNHERDLQATPNSESKSELVGYFLAQPLMFFEAQTQNLWVEHIQFSSLKARDELCERIYKMAREKKIQSVFFPNQGSVANGIQQYKPKAWTPPVFVLHPNSPVM